MALPGFERLPAELILEVASYLPNETAHDVFALARCNRFCYQQLFLYLVRLFPWKAAKWAAINGNLRVLESALSRIKVSNQMPDPPPSPKRCQHHSNHWYSPLNCQDCQRWYEEDQQILRDVRRLNYQGVCGRRPTEQRFRDMFDLAIKGGHNHIVNYFCDRGLDLSVGDPDKSPDDYPRSSEWMFKHIPTAMLHHRYNRGGGLLLPLHTALYQ